MHPKERTSLSSTLTFLEGIGTALCYKHKFFFLKLPSTMSCLFKYSLEILSAKETPHLNFLQI